LNKYQNPARKSGIFSCVINGNVQAIEYI
ncbi:MAG: hypothetical protein RL007_2502, partial [Bacteroidota bacterium]